VLSELVTVSYTTYHEAWQSGHLKAKGTAVLVNYDFIQQKSRPIPEDVRKKLEDF
jgi:acyl-CoA thioester hydrolase